MKKMTRFFTILGFVLALGTTYAVTANADSAMYLLDPSRAPGYVNLETGAGNVAPTWIISSGGSAAGGISNESDTFLNYIDPSRVAGYVDPETGAGSMLSRTIVTRGSAAGGIHQEPDTFLNFIDPSRLPGFVDRETGVIN